MAESHFRKPDVRSKLIDPFTLNVSEEPEAIIIMTMTAIYHEQNKESEKQSSTFERQLSKVEKRIRRLEERYVIEKTDRDIFTHLETGSRPKSGKLCKNPVRKISSEISNFFIEDLRVEGSNFFTQGL